MNKDKVKGIEGYEVGFDIWRALMIFTIGIVSLYCYWVYLGYTSSGEANEQLFDFFTGRNCKLGFLFYPAFASSLIGLQVSIFIYKHLSNIISLSIFTMPIMAVLGAVLAPIALLIGPIVILVFMGVALIKCLSRPI